jgi:hypothetical protein
MRHDEFAAAFLVFETTMRSFREGMSDVLGSRAFSLRFPRPLFLVRAEPVFAT